MKRKRLRVHHQQDHRATTSKYWKAKVLAEMIFITAGSISCGAIANQRANENVAKAEKNLELVRLIKKESVDTVREIVISEGYYSETDCAGEAGSPGMLKNYLDWQADRLLGMDSYVLEVDVAKGNVTEKTIAGFETGGVAGALVGALMLVIASKMRIDRYTKSLRGISGKALSKAAKLFREGDTPENRKETEQKTAENRVNAAEPVCSGKETEPKKQEDAMAIRGLEYDLEKSIRKHCGRECSAELAFALTSVLGITKTKDLIKQPDLVADTVKKNWGSLNQELKRYGWGVDEVLSEIEKRSGKVKTRLPPPVQEKTVGNLEVKLPVFPPKIMRSLEILRQAKDRTRGIDRKGLHLVLSQSGFKLVPSRSGGGHLKLEYDGKMVRNPEGRPFIVVRPSSGDLPYGTVGELLNGLIAYLENKQENDPNS